MGTSTSIEEELEHRRGHLRLQYMSHRFAQEILQISEMDWLEGLYFDDNDGLIQRRKGVFSYETSPGLRGQSPPVDLSPLSKLKSLRSLTLVYAEIEDIMPLAKLPLLEELRLPDALLDNFKPLGVMQSLQSLSLDGTVIGDLRPLEKLSNLTSLSLANCPKIEFIDYLANLENLESLNLMRTKVKNLGPLQGLTHLRRLNVDYTKVENLEPLRGHIERGLTVGIDRADIQVYSCSLSNPPQEVVKQGRKATIRYFRHGKTSWWLPPW